MDKKKEFEIYLERVIRENTGEHPTDTLINSISQKVVELFTTPDISDHTNIGAVIANFLSDKAKQYGIEQNKLIIDSNYGEIRLMRYDEGAYEKWKQLEIIKERYER